MQQRDRALAVFNKIQKLCETATRGFVRNAAKYKQAEARMRHAFRTRPTARRAARLRGIISSRIDEGRLPTTSEAMTSSYPGFGGECEACDRYMPPTRLVTAIQTGDTFVYLHGDCYIIWRAQCHLRAVLRRFV